MKLASNHLFKIARDNELWKRLCFEGSHSEAGRRRRDFLYGPPIPIQEPRVFELQRAVVRSGSRNASKKERATTARGLASWDPTYPDEKIDWYGEYIARHAPLSMSWLEQPFSEQNGLKEKVETRGLGMLKDASDSVLVAPLDDGSVCLWNIGSGDAAPNAQDGRIMARSRPGLLSVNGPDVGMSLKPTTSRAKMTSTGVVECVSVDKFRNKAYFALHSELNEVDLTTLQISSYHRYPFPITALSEAAYPVPLTVGTGFSLHLHDPRLGNDGGTPSSLASERVDSNANFSDELRYGNTDFHRLSSGDPLQTDYATLFPPSPLSILHFHPSSTIYVAGRFPSILSYDRRYFPKLATTIHSGARLCSILSLPNPERSTLAAAGEYNGKGSLELYPLDSPSIGSPSNTIPEPTRNRTSASRSKLLSLTLHGTRLLFSDGDGKLKWVERDGSTLVRQWNINTFNTSFRDSESARGGIFNAQPNEGDVALKLLPVGTGARSEVCVWTGEKIGVLGFKDKPRFSFGVDETSGTCTPEGSSDGESFDQRGYERMMRRALKRQADEVRFVRGLGLSG